MPSSPSVPWRVDDLITLYATTFAGAVTVLIAWWGASGTTRLSAQLAWVNVAVAGVIIAGTGNAIWLLHGRRSVALRRRRLIDGRLPLGESEQTHVAPTAGSRGQAGGDAELVASSLMTRFHRHDCPMVEGKTVSAASRSSHELAGRRPCGVCQP